MKLNNGLNLDGDISNIQTGDLRYAENIELDSTNNFITNERGLDKINFRIANVVGIIYFDKGQITFSDTNKITICYTNVSPIIKNKIIIIPNIVFSNLNPIRGTYSYNENKNLIIIFSSGVNGNFEDKIINVDSYEYDINNTKILTEKEEQNINLNPDIKFPLIKTSTIDGLLLAGSYQVAICYKIDTVYSNYSLLSIPKYIYNSDINLQNQSEGNPIKSLTTKGLNIDLQYLDDSFNFFKISIIYNNGTNYEVYDTEDIKITDINMTYTLKSLFNLKSSTLNSKLVNSIFYSNSEALSVLNNKLYRANVKSLNFSNFDEKAQLVANNVTLKLISKEITDAQDSNYKSKQYVKFQNDEVYALYLTFGDKKGNIIGSYPILSNNILSYNPHVAAMGLNYDVPESNLKRFVLKYTKDLISITYNSTKISCTLQPKLLELIGENNVEFTVSYIIDGVTHTLDFILNSSIDTLQQTRFSGTITSIFISECTPNNPVEYANYYYVPKEYDIDIFKNGTIRYYTNIIQIGLPNNIEILLGEEYNKIGFWCVHRAERNNNNSKIYTQGILSMGIYQGKKDNIYCYAHPIHTDIEYPVNTTYKDYECYLHNQRLIGGEEASATSQKTKVEGFDLRFYSFEDLFNKNEYFPLSEIQPIGKYTKKLLFDELIYDNTKNEDYFSINYKVPILKQGLIEDNNLALNNILADNYRSLKVDKDVNFLMKGSITSDPFFFVYMDDNIGSGGRQTYMIDVNNLKSLFRVNILNSINEYYKDLYNEVLTLCTPIATLNTIYLECEGDTFYSKFNILFNRILPTNYPTTKPFLLVSQLTDETIINERKKRLIYSYFVESKYNIHARWWESPYPDWEQPINTSTYIGYNKTFNLQNTLNQTSIVNILNNYIRKNNKGIYPYRIVESIPNSSESNGLNFRKFLAASYYDMPYDRGEIFNILTTLSKMYIMQELTTTIASIKDVLSVDEGSTYIGKGDLFDRLPTELIPTKYGYLGSKSYFNSGICDLGVWIIDSEQSIIALISDSNIELISEGKNKNWFVNKLKGENPFIYEGSFIIYDNSIKNKRLLLINHLNNYTLSYNPNIKNWTSFHKYIPLFGGNTRNDTYFIFELGDYNYMYNFSKTLKCKFSDNLTPYESIISLYINNDPSIKKFIESVIWDTKFFIEKTNIYDKTFTSIFIHNDSQCTNKINIGDNNEWFDSKNGIVHNDIWILNAIYDYVKNNKKPFLDGYMTFIESNFNYNKEWFDISKFIAKFACVSLIFDNYFYSEEGNLKSQTLNSICKYEPSIVLNDIDIKISQPNY